MKAIYEGFEIKAVREGEVVHTSVFRVSDGWELGSEYSYDLTVIEAYRDAKVLVGDYIKNPQDYDE